MHSQHATQKRVSALIRHRFQRQQTDAAAAAADYWLGEDVPGDTRSKGALDAEFQGLCSKVRRATRTVSGKQSIAELHTCIAIALICVLACCGNQHSS